MKFKPVANDFDSLIWVRDEIAKALKKAVNNRDTKTDWIEHETKLVCATGQLIAGRYGLTRPSYEQVKIADQQAAGHIDWMHKLCLCVAEIIVYGKRRGPL